MKELLNLRSLIADLKGNLNNNSLGLELNSSSRYQVNQLDIQTFK